MSWELTAASASKRAAGADIPIAPRLASDPSGRCKMAGADVHIEVKAATSRLIGTVQHASNRNAAMAIARATGGVARVQNDVRVEGVDGPPAVTQGRSDHGP